jgi:hypothetical protein
MHGSPEVTWLVGVAAAVGTTVAVVPSVDVIGAVVEDICVDGEVETWAGCALFGELCEDLVSRKIVVEAKMIISTRATEAIIGHG